MTVMLAEFFADLPVFVGGATTSHAESHALWSSEAALLGAIAVREQQLAARLVAESATEVRCFSEPAGREVSMQVTLGADGSVNWRETLICAASGLNNRARAAVGLLLRRCDLRPGSHLFVTEQTTDLYRWLAHRYPNLTGSEYLDEELKSGDVRNGIRHEDLTRLSLADGSQDVVGSFDCLEHIPDYRGSLAEILRVMRPGGTALLTFPFTGQPTTLVRASHDQRGQLVHHLPPEYHGDPVGRSGGVLCYYHFGYDVLADMRSVGFSEASVLWLWSPGMGHLGGLHSYILGRR